MAEPPAMDTISIGSTAKRAGLRPFGSNQTVRFPGLQPGLGKRLGLRPERLRSRSRSNHQVVDDAFCLSVDFDANLLR